MRADSGNAADRKVRAGLLVRPDTVNVGDHFELIVKVVVPSGARIEWPTIEDTAALVVMRSPVRIDATELPDGRTETASYALTAWDIGSLPIGLPDAIVRFGGTMMHVPLATARIVVQTVLPGDTTLHKPKPAKELFPRVVPWWEQWWPVFVVLAALALLWWLYRRRRRYVAVRSAKPIDVYARAMHDFDRLHALALVDAGEGGRYVALAVEVLRSYLAARIPVAQLSHTTAELLQVTSTDARVPAALLASVLGQSDAVKFGQHAVLGADARALAAQARAIVDAIEQADLAKRAAEDAERKAKVLAEQEEDDNANETARRRSRTTAGAA